MSDKINVLREQRSRERIGLNKMGIISRYKERSSLCTFIARENNNDDDAVPD